MILIRSVGFILFWRPGSQLKCRITVSGPFAPTGQVLDVISPSITREAESFSKKWSKLICNENVISNDLTSFAQS